MKAKKFLEGKIKEEILLYYRNLESAPAEVINSIVERWSNDDLNSESKRYLELEKYIPNARQKKTLDMSSGCGSFVIQGLRKNWDVYGVEPEQWKHDLIDLKFNENDYPPEWRSRIVKGVGEKLPFENDSFEVFNSWQTFEHVQNVQDCLNELYRVLKPGGKGMIHCPSYMTFFEGHYRLFWLPMLGNSSFGRFYVKLMGRPIDGLKTFAPINHQILKKKAEQAGFTIIDLTRKEVIDAAKRKFSFLNGKLGLIGLPFIYWVWKSVQSLKRFGRHEKAIHILLTKQTSKNNF